MTKRETARWSRTDVARVGALEAAVRDARRQKDGARVAALEDVLQDVRRGACEVARDEARISRWAPAYLARTRAKERALAKLGVQNLTKRLMRAESSLKSAATFVASLAKVQEA